MGAADTTDQQLQGLRPALHRCTSFASADATGGSESRWGSRSEDSTARGCCSEMQGEGSSICDGACTISQWQSSIQVDIAGTLCSGAGGAGVAGLWQVWLMVRRTDADPLVPGLMKCEGAPKKNNGTIPPSQHLLIRSPTSPLFFAKHQKQTRQAANCPPSFFVHDASLTNIYDFCCCCPLFWCGAAQ